MASAVFCKDVDRLDPTAVMIWHKWHSARLPASFTALALSMHSSLYGDNQQLLWCVWSRERVLLRPDVMHLKHSSVD